MRTYEELRGGHPPRDIRAELLRIGEEDSKPRILLNPRTGRKTIIHPEPKKAAGEPKTCKAVPRPVNIM